MKKNGQLLGLLLVVLAFLSTTPSIEAQNREGIKVHGHWTIEVRNPDGRPVHHIEFDNALLSDGTKALSRLLGDDWVVVHFDIKTRSAGTSPCSSIVGCEIKDPKRSSGKVQGNYAVLMSGQITADQNGTIEDVLTDMVVCMKTLPACEGGDFSSAHLTSPVTVVTGQIVQISIAFTFS